MTSVLSLIMTLAMLFSGSNTLTSKPETAQLTTLSGISVEVGGEIYSINDTLTFTKAIGPDEIVETFSAVNGDSVKMPFAVSLSSDRLRIALNDSDHYYELSSAYVDRITGYDADTLQNFQTQIDTLEPAIRYAVSLKNSDSFIEFANQFSESFVNTAAIDDAVTADEINGVPVNYHTYNLNLTMTNLCKALDLMRSGSNSDLSDALNSILRFLSARYSETADSYESLCVDSVEETVPAKFSTAVSEDETVHRTTFDLAYNDELAVHMELTAINHDMNVIFDLSSDSDYSGFNYSYSVSLTETGENTFDVNGTYQFTLNDETPIYYDDGSEIIDTVTDETEFNMNLIGTLTDDLISCTMEGSCTDHSSGSQDDTDNVDDQSIPFTVTVDQTKNSANGIDTVCRIELSDIDPTGNITVSFTAGTGEVLYAYPFTGEAIQMDEDFDSNAQAVLSWTGDLMGFVSDTMEVLENALPKDFDISSLELAEIPDLLLGGFDDAYCDTYNTDDAVMNEYATFSEAASAELSTELPEFKTPDGYTLCMITGDDSTVIAQYIREEDDSFINLFFTLKEDNITSDDVGYLYDDDGNVFSIYFPYDNNLSVTADFTSMPEADATTLLTDMGFNF